MVQRETVARLVCHPVTIKLSLFVAVAALSAVVIAAGDLGVIDQADVALDTTVGTEEYGGGSGGPPNVGDGDGS